MFENFRLETDGEIIAGYSWIIEKPHHVVCIVHGIGEHAGRYDRMAMKMQENDIAVLSMDLRGHGISTGKRGHCAPREAVLSDVDHLIAEAGKKYPEVPVILYGHSMGGNIALDYRRRGRLKDTPAGYVASAPWIILVRKISRALTFTMKLLSVIRPDFQIKAGIKNEDLGNRELIDRQQNKELRHDFITARTVVDGNEIGEQLLATSVGGKKLLLMHGDEDKICSVEGSRKFLTVAQSCEYVEWAGYFHEIHNGNRDEDGQKVIDYAIEWIKTVSR